MMGFNELFQQGNTVNIRHPDIQQYKIRRTMLYGITGTGTVPGNNNRIAFVFEDLTDQAADIRFIVDNEYVGF